jgi:hypothetical protein
MVSIYYSVENLSLFGAVAQEVVPHLYADNFRTAIGTK